MRNLIATLFAFLALMVPALAQSEDPALTMGRERSEAFLAGNIEPIWAEMTPELQSALGSIEGFRTFRDQVATDFGTEQSIDDEIIAAAGPGISTYNRIATWTETPSPVLMQWFFTVDGKIASFGVRPRPVLADSRFLDYETKADLRLPFEGEWYVFWGGPTFEQNHHVVDRAQRFGLDLVIVRDGASHSGDASVLENYYCWDAPILAPAAGTVVSAVNDLPDLPIGQMDTDNLAGNHVVLDLGNSEYFFLAHMREGSVRVSLGDTVAQGDELGRCGNSGNTSEPHLHIHMQTTTDLAAGEGLPTQFQNYLAGGTLVTRGEPLQGEVVSNKIN